MLEDLIALFIGIAFIVWHVYLLKKFRDARKQHIPFKILDLICLLIVNFIVAFYVIFFIISDTSMIIIDGNDVHPLIGAINFLWVMYYGIIASGILAALGDIIILLIFIKHKAIIKAAKENPTAIEAEQQKDTIKGV